MAPRDREPPASRPGLPGGQSSGTDEGRVLCWASLSNHQSRAHAFGPVTVPGLALRRSEIEAYGAATPRDGCLGRG